MRPADHDQQAPGDQLPADYEANGAMPTGNVPNLTIIIQ